MDFGFEILKSSTLNLSSQNFDKYNQLLKSEPEIISCIGCGTCCSACTSQSHNPINLREIMLLLQRGYDNKVINSLHNCFLCGKCITLCPRGINTRNIIINILKIYQ